MLCLNHYCQDSVSLDTEDKQIMLKWRNQSFESCFPCQLRIKSLLPALLTYVTVIIVHLVKSQERNMVITLTWALCSTAFAGGSDGKASAYNAGGLGSIPGPGRYPGGGNGNALQYFFLENPMDRGAW